MAALHGDHARLDNRTVGGLIGALKHFRRGGRPNQPPFQFFLTIRHLADWRRSLADIRRGLFDPRAQMTAGLVRFVDGVLGGPAMSVRCAGRDCAPHVNKEG